MRFESLRVRNSLELIEGGKEEERVKKLTLEQIEGEYYKRNPFRISLGFLYF